MRERLALLASLRGAGSAWNLSLDPPANAMVSETVTHSPEQTLATGRQLASEFHPPCLVILEGELGSGKTTLAKGIVAGLGAAREEAVSSPTFTLVHEYGNANKVYHVDLYRIEDAPFTPTYAEAATWRARGFHYVSVRVPGLSKPWYTFLKRIDRTLGPLPRADEP